MTGLGIQVLSTAVLSRLLLPGDFGLVAMVTTFSLLVMNFGLNGFTEAIVQRSDLTMQQASNLFWINVGCSTVLSLGFAAAGPVLARIYGDAHLIGIAHALSLTIFFTGIQVVHLALLKRQMRFGAVSANDLASRLFSVLTAIVLALLGWGYWALVAAAVVIPVSTSIGAWLLCRWVPKWPRREPGTGAMVRFAINIYGRFTTGYFTNNIDNFLVGWKLGAIELGYYKRAYDLFILSSNQISTGLTIVAVSALRRLHSNPPEYRRYLMNALRVMCFIGMGIGGALTLTGRDLVAVVLGPHWLEAGRIFTYFSPGIGFMLLYFTHVWIHLSIGRPDRWFRWGFVDLSATTVLLYLGLHWHAQGVAIAWGIAYLVITFPALWYAGQPIEFNVAPVAGEAARCAGAALAAGLSAWRILALFPQFMVQTGTLAAAERLLAGLLLFGALYIAMVVLIFRSVTPLVRVLGLMQEMLSRRKSAAATEAQAAVESTV